MVTYQIKDLETGKTVNYKNRNNAVLDYRVLKSLGYRVSYGVVNCIKDIKEYTELAR